MNINLLNFKQKIFFIYLCKYHGHQQKIKNINLQDDNGCTALLLYCKYSNSCNENDVIKLLAKSGALLNLSEKNKWCDMVKLIKYTFNYNKWIKSLIDAGANLNLQNKYGSTALMESCRYANVTSNAETVKMLIDAGANLDLQNKDKCSALMIVSKYYNTDSNIGAAKLLIDAGANLDLQDRCSALINERSKNSLDIDIEIVKLLINALLNACQCSNVM